MKHKQQKITKRSCLYLFYIAFLLFPLASIASLNYTPMEDIPGYGKVSDFPQFILAVYNFGIWTIGICAMLMIIIGGMMYITSASTGNASSTGKAKGFIVDALIGLIMALTAYLILYTINPELVGIKELDKDSVSASKISSSCCIQTNDKTDSLYGKTENCPSAQTDASGDGPKCSTGTLTSNCQSNSACGGGAGAGSGKCTTMTSGYCSVDNLKNTCFGENASAASSICNVESRGIPTSKSGSDKCKTGEPFSMGLFQIKLSVHKIDGLDCPSAFTSTTTNCTIKNKTLYDQCVAAATDPQKNITYACKLSTNGNHWGHWGRLGGGWGANSKCGFKP